MDPFLAEWLNVLLRWAHLVAGIAWIGTSFYFVALDFSLRRRDGLPEGVAGEAWEVHGGGFYLVRKYLVAPRELPADLIWFKWEAYLTWVTGFLLLVALYYLDAASYLIDPSVRELTEMQAIGISLAGLAVSWFAYDALCRSGLGRHTGLLALAVLVLIMALSGFYSQVFSGRGALIHVGASVGTMMAANVFAVIIPNQRKITAALLAGEAPDPRLGAVGKQRSLHNTYLTLPVLLMMVSNHYPVLTGAQNLWALVGLVMVGGAMLRHFLVRYEVGDDIGVIAWTLPVIGGALAGALYLTEPPRAPLYAGEVSDAEALSIAVSRCASCHAARPLDPTTRDAPKGVMLETIDDLRRFAPRVAVQSVHSKAMPLGNKTGMTDDERAKLGAWIARQ